MLKSLKKKIVKDKKNNLLLFVILTAAFLIRVYRLGDLIGFYYDQGRDALVIWDLWEKSKFFLIGPTTGLSGIFLGPFYYYLIAPFYLIGSGNPVYPAVFLSFLSTLALYLLYFLGTRIHSKRLGFVVLIFGAFSYGIFEASRWLSNPTPILLTSVIFIFLLWEIISDKRAKRTSWLWVLASFTAGISLHFEAASGVFYIPILLLFLFWQRKNILSIKYIVLSLIAFLVTLLPQLLFDLRHDHILFNNFKNLFITESAFGVWNKLFVTDRIRFFSGAFLKKLIPSNDNLATLIVSVSLAGYFSLSKKLRNNLFTLFSIFFFVPLVGYILFKGNFGTVYDYYLSGYFLPFLLFVSIGLVEILRRWGGKVILLVVLCLFLFKNLVPINNYLFSNSWEKPITLDDQIPAVNWIISDQRDELEYNLDVYVPPVIPYAYDYLFLWQTSKNCDESKCGWVDDRQVKNLYLLFEDDIPHPERLKAWLNRMDSLSTPIKEERFGGITVQKRERNN